LSHDTSLTREQVEALIIHNDKDLYTTGWDQLSGWGRIDAYQTIAEYLLEHLESHCA
jgi:hypothetical protein